MRSQGHGHRRDGVLGWGEIEYAVGDGWGNGWGRAHTLTRGITGGGLRVGGQLVDETLCRTAIEADDLERSRRGGGCHGDVGQAEELLERAALAVHRLDAGDGRDPPFLFEPSRLGIDGRGCGLPPVNVIAPSRHDGHMGQRDHTRGGQADDVRGEVVLARHQPDDLGRDDDQPAREGARRPVPDRGTAHAVLRGAQCGGFHAFTLPVRQLRHAMTNVMWIGVRVNCGV